MARLESVSLIVGALCDLLNVLLVIGSFSRSSMCLLLTCAITLQHDLRITKTVCSCNSSACAI